MRTCAVLWTLRVAQTCNPAFRMDPIRARFNDLANAERNTAFSRDLEERSRPKVISLPISKEGRHARIKWQLAAAAAAALLLAGVLSPSISSARSGDMSIRQWMTGRATRTFADDFRSGLDQWKASQSNRPKSWSYSTDGFIHPAELALYSPSMGLADYRFEFLTQIENKSVDCVIRAHDPANYYALKFTVVEPGPRPVLAMFRYPVIRGKKGRAVQMPLRMMIHANTPYRVSVDVKGSRYQTYVDGEEADFWTDDRLRTGGVGFFSDAGERARVYWVKLESNGDLLGRICGMLSAYNSHERNTKEIRAWTIGMQIPEM